MNGSAIYIPNREGVILAMTQRYKGKQVLDTFLSSTLKATMGEQSLLFKQGAAHTRLRKILHPTLNVSLVYCLLCDLCQLSSCARNSQHTSTSAVIELVML
jgi:hypothetical protein